MQELDAVQGTGDKKLSELRTLGEKVSLSTSERGGKALKATVTSMEDAWNQHLAKVGEYKDEKLSSAMIWLLLVLFFVFDIVFLLRERLSSIDRKCDKIGSCSIGDVRKNLSTALDHWKLFDEGVETHSSWCREMESFFKDQPLCATLEEKQDQVEVLAQKREEVVQYERDIDMFVDQSHALVRISSVDRLKPLITQLSNRYQSLHVLTKEAVTKWRGIVSDHEAFEEKFEENERWLESVEEALDEYHSEMHPEKKNSQLQHLLSEREQATHRLASITTIGERLYPDTATNGREKLRQELRMMRERWERLEAAIVEEQRKQEAQSLQWSSFSDSIQAARNWLDNMERTIVVDPSNWLSLQELRSRLLKMKVWIVLFLMIRMLFHSKYYLMSRCQIRKLILLYSVSFYNII